MASKARITPEDVRIAQHVLDSGHDVELRRRGSQVLVLEVRKTIRNNPPPEGAGQADRGTR